jgi:hypothetical protein
LFIVIVAVADKPNSTLTWESEIEPDDGNGMAYPFKAANRALRKSEGIVFSPKSYLFLYYCIYMNKIVVSNNTAVLVNFAEHLSIVSIKRNVFYQCIYMIFGLLHENQWFLILHCHDDNNLLNTNTYMFLIQP